MGQMTKKKKGVLSPQYVQAIKGMVRFPCAYVFTLLNLLGFFNFKVGCTGTGFYKRSWFRKKVRL